MSKIEVDTIEPQSGTTITLGASGDTITVPSGATLDVTSATVSGISSYTNSDALTLFNASGSAPVYACRAWVNFNGTGTPAINGSGNVTSITDNGTGSYTANFTTAIQDANYVTHLTIGGGLRHLVSNQTSSSVSLSTYNTAGSLSDIADIYISVFR